MISDCVDVFLTDGSKQRSTHHHIWWDWCYL